MCIDATEVTRGQYQAFLTDRAGDASGQSAECAWNLYFDPPATCVSHLYDVANPDNHPQECVDWCDAAAFCAWSGKRLCGGIDNRHVVQTDVTNANKDEWFNACSSGGVNPYPFGATCQSSPCTWGGYASTEAGQAQGCQASGAYAGVFDLSGNVREWEDSCTGVTGKNDYCQTRGNAYATVFSDCLSANQQGGLEKCSYVAPLSTLLVRDAAGPGFRCCAQ
jgi:formylglycine-generating enzyme required for sulfatase activity